MKNIRKEGGNEEEWTVEGFGKATATPATELKPSVRFYDENSLPSLEVSTSEPSHEETRPAGKFFSRTQTEPERAR